MIDDVQRQGKRPLDILYLLSNSGTIIEAVFELEGAGTLEDEPSNRLPFVVLFSSELPPQMADVIFDLPASQIHVIHSPQAEELPQAAEPVVSYERPPEPVSPDQTFLPPPEPDQAELALSNFSAESAAQTGGMESTCLLYTSPSPRDRTRSRMPSSA